MPTARSPSSGVLIDVAYATGQPVAPPWSRAARASVSSPSGIENRPHHVQPLHHPAPDRVIVVQPPGGRAHEEDLAIGRARIGLPPHARHARAIGAPGPQLSVLGQALLGNRDAHEGRRAEEPLHRIVAGHHDRLRARQPEAELRRQVGIFRGPAVLVVRVAGLVDEPLDHPVEQQAVVGPLARQQLHPLHRRQPA